MTTTEQIKACAELDWLTTGSKTAIIRQCDVCGMTTAIDLDSTPENFVNMQLYGQYVREVSREKAMELWKTAGKCKCVR